MRTPGGLLGRYLALNGVAARTAKGAKGVQLSSRGMAFQTFPVTILSCKSWVLGRREGKEKGPHPVAPFLNPQG
jgi:hypothetical protein